jgi:hypothetical protein
LLKKTGDKIAGPTRFVPSRAASSCISGGLTGDKIAGATGSDVKVRAEAGA